MTLNCFEPIEMEFPKIENLLATAFDDKDLPSLLLKMD